MGFPGPRGQHSRATQSPELSRSRHILCYRRPQATLQRRPGPRHPRPAHPGVLRCSARSTSTPSWRGGPGETGPAPQLWALRPPRGAGWRARRCWPSLCGSAWRPGLPLWVRSPLPRRKAERPGAGGRDGDAERTPRPDLPGILELKSWKGPDTLCSFIYQRGSTTGPGFPSKLVVSRARFLFQDSGLGQGPRLEPPSGSRAAGVGRRPRPAGRRCSRRREKRCKEVPCSHHPCSRAGKGGSTLHPALPLKESSGDRGCSSLWARTHAHTRCTRWGSGAGAGIFPVWVQDSVSLAERKGEIGAWTPGL